MNHAKHTMSGKNSGEAYLFSFHTYTVLHMFTQLLFWAGNQDNHQKFRPILAVQETLTDFHGDEAKMHF